MPRITTERQLSIAMYKLQQIFESEQNTDVSISRAKFNDWADSYGNKTLLFQSLYTKGIPISDLAKWLSPTQNQGQVRNAVVKINDVEYIRGVCGRYVNPDNFREVLRQGANTSIASSYTNAIRFWWNQQSGNQQRVVRQPRTTRTTRPTLTRQEFSNLVSSGTEPTTSNGGTTEITEGVLNSVYQIIKSYHSGIQWWLSNSILADPTELRISWMRYLNQGLLSPNHTLLVNPVATEFSRNLLFWSSQNDATKIMLQRMGLILLFDLNDFTRLLTYDVLELPNDFAEQFRSRFGQQNTQIGLLRALEIKHPSFKSRVKFTSRENNLILKIYAGRITSSRTTQSTSTTRETTTASASNVRNRDIPFTNTFGIEIEYHNAPASKIISECKKVGIVVANVGYTHAITDYWKLVTDGSVYGTNALEFVSPILRGNKGFVILRKALTAVTKAGMFANNTAGTHIHFGAKDFTLQTWKNILINYQGFQPLIDKYCAKYRESNHIKENGSVNHYIEPTGNMRNWKQGIENATSFRDLQLMMLKHKSEETNRGWEYENRRGGRYFNVNLFAYPKQGTIEFRQLGSSIEFDMIQNWILFLHYLIAISEKKTLTNFTFKGLLDILPQSVSTYWHNRIFDLNTPFNKTPQDINTPYEDRS